VSNKDVQPSASQAAAAAAFSGEVEAQHANGQVDMQQYWQKHIGNNVANKLYKNA